jgi:hypothetical protein
MEKEVEYFTISELLSRGNGVKRNSLMRAIKLKLIGAKKNKQGSWVISDYHWQGWLYNDQQYKDTMLTNPESIVNY